MKLKKIIAVIVFLFIGVFSLASCSSNKSGISESDVVISTKSKTSKTVKLEVRFSANDNLAKGLVTTHFKEYKVTDGEESYANVDQSFSVDTSTYSGEIEFTGLSATTTYRFKLYVTYSGTDSLITSYDVTTANSSQTEDDAVHITTTTEFINMANDPTSYYVLDNDLDFDKATLSTIFSSSVKFSGTFDGMNHTISNYVLPSNEYTGLFAYTSGATIKNLNVSGVTTTLTSRGATKCGSLIGYAERTNISNCTVDNVSISFSGTLSSISYVGGVIGRGLTLTVTDTTATNITITMPDARLKISTGLFIGSIEDNGLIDNIAVSGCSAEGKISVVTHYNTSSTGYMAVGGFVGNCNTRGLITKSSCESEIIISKYAVSSTDMYNLYVGGFIGTNNLSTINVSSCLAATTIKAYAGTYETEDGEEVDVDYSSNMMTKGIVTDSDGKITGKYLSYLGGFVGRIQGSIDKIDDCYVLFTGDVPIYANTKVDNSGDDYSPVYTISETEGEHVVTIDNDYSSNEAVSLELGYTTLQGTDVTISSGNKVDSGQEIGITLKNDLTNTIVVSIYQDGELVSSDNVSAGETYLKNYTVSGDVLIRVSALKEVYTYVYVGNVAGSFGDVEDKVTNTTSSEDETISSDLYALFKELVDKYLALVA